MTDRQRRAIVYKLRDAKTPNMFTGAVWIIAVLHIVPLSIFLTLAINSQ